MKKIMIFSILAILFFNCKKSKEDYRDKWCGTYSGEYTHEVYTSTVYVISTYNETIEVRKSGDNELFIQDFNEAAKVDKVGRIDMELTDCKISAFFINDSLYINKSTAIPAENVSNSFRGRKLIKN
ncbi:MAG: hypothetical protein LBR36_01145 [Bacteroidales bacterium]|nr:hypothetical protein [Bacteroidales bacterium]